MDLAKGGVLLIPKMLSSHLFYSPDAKYLGLLLILILSALHCPNSAQLFQALPFWQNFKFVISFGCVIAPDFHCRTC